MSSAVQQQPTDHRDKADAAHDRQRNKKELDPIHWIPTQDRRPDAGLDLDQKS
jgi:hypothetical protein